MNRRIILSPDARVDLISIARWYRRERVDLAFRFRAEVQEALLRIARFPRAFSCVDRVRFVRRFSMRRFRYYIYWAVTPDTVLVKGIIHQRRADTVWEERKRGDDD
jgi:plasmid stabilization system protein ParE